MIRTGIGFDAHRFAESRRLVLCGAVVPHHVGLLGHSDADVATHALIDAILGAAAIGDIGKLFPDTDNRWKDADSVELLRDVVARICRTGWGIVNVDITIVCEAPKLAPHIDKMRANISDALRIGGECVSVKATTVEGLGAIGRREGISAMAVATISD